MTPHVLYEDNHLLVAVKPQGMPSQADASGDPDFLSVCREYIRVKYNKPGNTYLGLVQRLDRPTGGIMVFARTSKAAARLSEQIRNRQIRKIYRAVVVGDLPAEKTLKDYLVKDEKSNTVRVGDENEGKYAELTYKVLDQRGNHSLVEVELMTGRSHQIRVQFASRGCPLYGDVRYGKGEGNTLALFASGLTFQHPTKKEEMNFSFLPENEIFSEFKK